jgi:hypothetical protein
MEDVGENTTTWRMKENALTSRLGHIEPSTELELNSENVVENSYRRLVISNPSMMCIYEEGVIQENGRSQREKKCSRRTDETY